MARVLIVGGTGFIGRHIAGRLQAAGDSVVAAARVVVDLAREDEASLRDKVAGFDVVVNCAGLVRDKGANTMAAVHAEGPSRLFRACVAAGVRRFVQVSALGVAASGDTAYQRTKAAAEACFMASDLQGAPIDWHVLRPSVVIGRGGASTTWLLAAAALPIVPRFGDESWRVQPVHVDDLADLVVRLVEGVASPRQIDVVGPSPMNIAELTTILRSWLGLPPARSIRIPDALLDLSAAIGERFANGPLNHDVLKMLSRGNVGDPGPFAAALGRPPRALARALALTPAAEADRTAARLFFLRPVLRWCLGLLWIMTALLSFGVYPIEKSYQMLSDIGLTGLAASIALYGGACVDLLLGALLLARWRPALVGLGQLASMSAFTLLAIRLPSEYWLHPFAPILKNLPIAAAILIMIALES